MSDHDSSNPSRRAALTAAGLAAAGLAVTAGAARADGPAKPADSNQRSAQPPLIEASYPLDSDADRAKTVKLCQQVTVDLLAMFNLYKQAHWNLNGPLYLVLHKFYQKKADYYREQSDLFAERVLHMGSSVDGRYSTIARTSTIPDFPAGYDTDSETLRLLVERLTVLQKEVYAGIKATEQSDAPTSNKFQDLAYEVDNNLWQLRIHLARPGSLGDALPYASQQRQSQAK
jgi:starvation-inducible DNA-binding protein